MTADLACSYALVALVVLVGGGYGARSIARGKNRSARIEKAGSSVLLGADVMESAYWAIGPFAKVLARAEVAPDTITLVALAIGFGAAVCLGIGHHGIAAVLLAISSLGDALDGYVARARKVSSDAGEVVDAIADRYQELVILAGLLVVYRNDALGLGAAIAAIGGSFMISYTTAKAEAMGVPPPRGLMRRAERAVWINVAIALTPIAADLAARGMIPAWSGVVPEILAMTAIGSIGNVSAILRTQKIVAALRAKNAPSAPAPIGSSAQDAVPEPTPSSLHEEPAR